jgi:ribokinase
MHELACVGEIMVDVRVAMPLAEPGTRVHGAIELTPGGSPVTAAHWARAAGGAVLVAGRVGDDPAGRIVEEALEARGIETRLARAAGTRTGVCVYAGGGVTADRGANAGLARDDLPERLAATAVLVSGYLLLHDDSRAAGLAAIERADARWVAVGAASARLLRNGALDDLGAGVVLADEEEARVLTGEDGEAAARQLASRHEIAFVTLGDRGAVASSGPTTVSYATERVEPREPAGAGDAFAGVALLALARGARLEDALRAACRAGAARAAGADPYATPPS